MKIAVLILVLANLVLFAWLRWAQPGARGPDSGLVPPAAGGSVLKVLRSSPASPGAGSATSLGSGRCLTAGPMSAVAPAAALAASLGESGLAARTLVRAETVPRGYQVLLSGYADRASAARAAARLRSAGAGNLSIVDDKDGGNVISLGLYRSMDDARARVVAIKKLGFEPQIRIRARTASRWYLELPASASAAAAVRAAGVAVREERCPVEAGGSGSTASAPATTPLPRGAVPAALPEAAAAGGS